MARPMEIDEYQRRMSVEYDGQITGSSGGRHSVAATIVSRVAGAGVEAVAGSVRTAGLSRWLCALALGFVGSRCRIVTEDGVLAQSLLMATMLTGRTDLTVALTIGVVSGIGLSSAAPHELHRLVAFLALLGFLRRLLERSIDQERSRRSALVGGIAFVSAFAVRAVPALLNGERIAALPVSLAASGLVVAFGLLCSRAMTALSEAMDGRVSIRSLTGAEQGDSPYVLVLLMIVIGGLNTLTVGPIHLSHLLAATTVLLLALSHGTAIGSLVGAIVGLALSFAEPSHMPMIAVYSVAGMVTGLLSKGTKMTALALGAIAGLTSCLILTEALRLTPFRACTYLLGGSGIAYLIHMWSPDLFTVQSREGGGAAQESSPKILSARERLKSLSGVFDLLANTLSNVNSETGACYDSGFDALLEEMHARLCDSCGKHDACWNSRFYATYEAFLSLFASVELETVAGHGNPARAKAEDQPSAHLNDCCINARRVVSLARSILQEKRDKLLAYEQAVDTKDVISSQFKGLAEVVDRLIEEICSEEQVSCDTQRAQIVQSKAQAKGQARAQAGAQAQALAGAQAVEVGIYRAARDPSAVSGDSRLVCELGDGRTLIVIGDGMGTGDKAASDSRFATTMLKELIVAGMPLRSAIETVNSIMLIRRRDESFSTLDIAVFDPARRRIEFTKMGSCPSYVKRRRSVIRISSPSLPIGILPRLEFDTINQPVSPGDIVLMVSDGVLGSCDDLDAVDDWIVRYLESTSIGCPKQLVNDLADEMKSAFGATWDDDVTLIAVKV